MKVVRLALMGFGSAGQALARLLLEKEERIKEKYDTQVQVIAITTKTRGNLVDAWGIDLEKALKNMENSGRFDKVMDITEEFTSQEIAEKVDYDVLVEMTPLEFNSGKVAIDHIRAALSRGKHAVTANKGPIAWAYRELNDLAKKNNCSFLYETTVMDGAPIFNMGRNGLRLCKVTEIKGILNTTTNYILDELSKGKDYDEIVAESKRRGFMEANPAIDVEGYDAAVKVAVLANVLMDANLTPLDIHREGIEGITSEEIKKAADEGKVMKLLCRVYVEDGKVKGSVSLEEVGKGDVYASVTGTSSVITLTTDLMGSLTLIEQAPEIEQTGYGLFADILDIIENN